MSACVTWPRLPEWMQSELEELGLSKPGRGAHAPIHTPTRKVDTFRDYDGDH